MKQKSSLCSSTATTYAGKCDDKPVRVINRTPPLHNQYIWPGHLFGDSYADAQQRKLIPVWQR